MLLLLVLLLPLSLLGGSLHQEPRPNARSHHEHYVCCCSARLSVPTSNTAPGTRLRGLRSCSCFSLNAHMGSDILQDMSDEKLAAVCAPKAAGAAAFDAAHLPLVSQTLFSSTSAVWSQPAAGHYAAANAVADGIAAAQRAAGRPATAVQFGPFGGTGMAAAHTTELAAIGLPPLQPAEVLYYSCGFAWFPDPDH